VLPQDPGAARASDHRTLPGGRGRGRYAIASAVAAPMQTASPTKTPVATRDNAGFGAADARTVHAMALGSSWRA